MHEFETLDGFLEHVSLVMDTEQADDGERVSLMTLHAAKGLEFETVFLPGWEEGLFPHQRRSTKAAQAGLEEERRLAYVGLTRAQAASPRSRSRRTAATRGLYQSALPSRFVDELARGARRGRRGQDAVRRRLPEFRRHVRARRLRAQPLRRRRAVRRHLRHARLAARQGARSGPRSAPAKKWSPSDQRKARGPLTIEGELVASSSESSRVQARRARAAPEVRRRHGDRRRRQQADDRIRRGRPQTRRRQLRRPRLAAELLRPVAPRERTRAARFQFAVTLRRPL